MRTADVATAEAFQLAEGPVWDARRGRLLWVDIRAGVVLAGLVVGGAIRVVERWRFGGPVGAVAVAEDGAVLVAGRDRLIVVLVDRSRYEGPLIVPAGDSRRLNDGGVDPLGRFVVGTLSLDGASRTEVLVRVESDGRISQLNGDLTLSNGLAWSGDGSQMYSVDTERHTIFVRCALPEPVLGAGARGRDQHRNPAGRGHGLHPACLASARGRHGARHQRTGISTSARARTAVIP